MRVPLDWIKRLLGSEPSSVLALLTPQAVRTQGVVVRVALAGTAALGLAAAGTLGLFALSGLMAAIAMIYFLATRVLGLQIDVDPRAFYEQVQRQAAASAPSGYGPN